MSEIKQGCPIEAHVAEYYGADLRMLEEESNIITDFGHIVNVVAMYTENLQSQLAYWKERAEAAEKVMEMDNEKCLAVRQQNYAAAEIFQREEKAAWKQWQEIKSREIK